MQKVDPTTCKIDHGIYSCEGSNHTTCWICGKRGMLDFAYYPAFVRVSICIHHHGEEKTLTSLPVEVEVCRNCIRMNGGAKFDVSKKLKQLSQDIQSQKDEQDIQGRKFKGAENDSK